MRTPILVGLIVLLPAALLAQGSDMTNERPRKPIVIHADMPLDSETIEIVASGLVRNTQGQALANAAVELVVNPYYPGAASTRTWTATDAYGRYQVRGWGHHGTARISVAAEGHRMDIREMGFIKRSRELEFNFSLGPVRADGR